MFRKLLLVACCVSLFIFAGCEDKEKIQMQSDLTAKDARIAELESLAKGVAEARDQYHTYWKESQFREGEFLEKVDSLEKSTRSLRISLKTEKATSDSLRLAADELKPANVVLPMYKDSLANEITARQAAEAECVRLEGVVSERDALIASIKPWYDMYRYNATERNWFEKLWGADKKNPPGFVEPIF